MRHPAAILIALILLSACGATPPPSAGASPTPSPSTRPSTTAHVTIVSPTPGEVVRGGMVDVMIGLSGATITKSYSTNINGHEGHIHLYLDSQLIYMNYTLQQNVPVHPGFQYSLYAEFVAADHFPFSPRDKTPTIYFTVAH